MFNDHLSHSVKSSMRNKLNDEIECVFEKPVNGKQIFARCRGNGSDELSFF